MNIFKKIMLTVPVAVMFLSFAAVPVQAQDGISGGSSGSGSTSSSTSGPGGTGQESSEAAVPAATVKPEAKIDIEKSNTEHAKKELAYMEKAGRKKHADEERKKNCKGAQHGLETKLANMIKNAQKHQAHIDEVLTKAETFQAKNNVAGADQLITDAKAAQLKSQTSIAALQSITVKVNCDDPNVSQTVAGFKAAAAGVRTDLLAYRKTVKAVLVSFEQAKDTKESN